MRSGVFTAGVLRGVITGCSVLSALCLTAVTAVAGTLAGMAGGWAGGPADSLLMRTADICLAFPGLVLALAAAALLGGGLANAMLALAAVSWPKYARLARSQTPAILLLFLFAFAMAGMNPTAVAAAGRMTTVTSIAILLPAASLGAIVMPWVIGLVAETAGLTAGMASNIVPCVGMLVFAALVARLPAEEAA